MKIKIKVTKDVLRKSMCCGTEQSEGFITENCAISVAVRDVFPSAQAGIDNLTLYNIKTGILPYTDIPYLDIESVRNFMVIFDSTSPELRLELPEFELEVDLPEHVINSINIDDIHKSETLEVVL